MLGGPAPSVARVFELATAGGARLLPHLEAYYRAWEMPALTPYTVYNSRR